MKSAAGAVRSVAQSLLKAVSPELGVVGSSTDHLSAAEEKGAEAKSGKLSPQRNLQEIKVTIAAYLQWKYFYYGAVLSRQKSASDMSINPGTRLYTYAPTVRYL